MEPRGSSACVSWIRTWTQTTLRPPCLLQHTVEHKVLTFWKSMNFDLCVSRWKRERLLHTGFLQMVGGEYLNCCGTSLISAWQSIH